MGLETALILGAVGAAGFGVGKAISNRNDRGGSAPSPQPLPEPPKMDTAADEAQKKVRQRKAGQSQTVFTDPLGVSGQAEIVRKNLTGQ